MWLNKVCVCPGVYYHPQLPNQCPPLPLTLTPLHRVLVCILQCPAHLRGLHNQAAPEARPECLLSQCLRAVEERDGETDDGNQQTSHKHVQSSKAGCVPTYTGPLHKTTHHTDTHTYTRARTCGSVDDSGPIPCGSSNVLLAKFRHQILQNITSRNNNFEPNRDMHMQHLCL